MRREVSEGFIPVTEESQLDEIIRQSYRQPVLIYKHSTRCATSSMVLQRLERHRKIQDREPFPIFFLDLIAYRDISEKIAQRFDVEHESPQAILVFQGKSVYSASHWSIDYGSLLDQASHT